MARGGWRYGAGRPGWHVKAEHCLKLDVRDLARRQLLAGSSFTWTWTENETGIVRGNIGITTYGSTARLNYALNGTSMQQSMMIERTGCNYGGVRPWFRCPRCNHRVAVLFFRSGFACRKCNRVAYSSQAEDAMGRSWLRQRKLERRLGEHWARPKGMHQATRARVLDGIFQCEQLRDEALAAYMLRHGFGDGLGW